MIKQAWLESGTVYGYRKVTDDLRDLGEQCGKHRVARLMKGEGLRAQVGYGRRPRPRGGRVSTVAPNHLDRQFDVAAPNTHWVTDITYIRTYEGWLYLAAVMDLYSRQIVGWATQSTMTCDLVLQALLGHLLKGIPIVHDVVAPVMAVLVPVMMLTIWWIVRRIRHAHGDTTVEERSS